MIFTKESYEIFIDGTCKAFCRGWDAKQAALRLLCGTALMLPPNVRVTETTVQG